MSETEQTLDDYIEEVRCEINEMLQDSFEVLMTRELDSLKDYTDNPLAYYRGYYKALDDIDEILRKKVKYG